MKSPQDQGAARRFLPAPRTPSAAGAPTGERVVRQFDRFEHAFFATGPVSSSCDVDLVVEFTGPGNARRRVRAFWFGSREWRVRFMPTAPGRWTFRTRSTPRIAGLHDSTGTFLCTANAASESNRFLRHGPLRVSRSGRNFEHADGTPFFWLGDTVWNGPTMVRSEADWATFLDHRAAQGFNAIQFVATQWRTAPTNPEGEVAFTGREPIWINPHWFERIDRAMDALAARGFLAVPVVIWTLGPEDINPSTLPEREIVKLARYIVARYQAHPVAWILNGDGRYHGAAAEKWKRIGRAVFDAPGHAPVLQHPGGMQWPHDAFRNEKWIDAIGYQTGHGDDAETLQWIHSGPPARKWSQRPARPHLNLEPPYEDHICYQSRKRHNAYTVRRAGWWSVLATPPAGLTYGAHGVWSWEEAARPPADHAYTGVAQPWWTALRLPGAAHMQHLAAFLRARPWWKLAPAPALVVSSSRPAPKPRRLHLVFSRNLDGETALWVDGIKRASGWVGGDLSTWAADVHLALGNESTGDFGWRGTIHRLALHARALAPYETAAPRAASDPLAAWKFDRPAGTIRDHAGKLGLDLRILTPDKIRWRRDGLVLDADAEVKSIKPARSLVAALQASRAVSLELELTPADWSDRACGRIVSLQTDRWDRNLALGQVAREFTANVRTSATGNNAEPTLATAVAQSAFEFIAAAATPRREQCVFYLPVGGAVRIALAELGRNPACRWFNPRTGRYSPARRTSGTFVAPTREDWVLHIESKPR